MRSPIRIASAISSKMFNNVLNVNPLRESRAYARFVLPKKSGNKITTY